MGYDARAFRTNGLSGLLFVCAAALVSAAPARADEADYGNPGGPVKLVVGYQPYGTENLDAVILREKEFWKKYLPPGSQVDMQIALQGSIIVNNMLAAKQHIGFMGDMPSIVSTTKERVADIRIVAVNSVDPMCQYLVVRSDAPNFKTPQEAFRWLNGKVVAAPKGSCADRFMNVLLAKENIKPEAYLNQGNELIVSNFRAKRLDAAVTWEPYIGKMVADGLVKIVTNGEPYNENNVTFIVMRADLIKKRPDVVKAWLNAELDAHLFLADLKNEKQIVDAFVKANPGYAPKVFWDTLYGTYPGEQGRSKARLTFVFTFTPQVMDIIEKDVKFLRSVKAIDVDKLRPDAIERSFADEVLRERGLKPPVGVVYALPKPSF
jgi:NitT/TauT family transport system substrate-binding protein